MTLPLKPAGSINSRFVDDNIHASIERMNRYENHAKALKGIMLTCCVGDWFQETLSEQDI